MTPWGKFIIYTAVLSYLMDDVTFAYQVSSTNFESIAGSILFSGNICRLKALSAEQIYLRYIDKKDSEKRFAVMAYIIEAISSAKEALSFYRGEFNGEHVGFENKYGMGLQNFHLGYLYDKYAD